VVDVQALAGDSVDNVPGAPGIGVKTAALLINEYGDLDTLLARADEIKQPKRRQTLIENADQIRLSGQLVTLDCDMPAGRDARRPGGARPEPETLLAFLAEMEFRTLTKRIADSAGRRCAGDRPDPGGAEAESVARPARVPRSTRRYEIVRDAEPAGLDRRGRETRLVAVDTETTSLNEMTAELVGLSLSVEPGRACYIPLTTRPGGRRPVRVDAPLAEGQMALEEALALLKPVLEDDAVLKIGRT
jgi:DNA polymerase-1